MTIQKDVSLASLTTFRIGGPAAFLVDAASTDEAQDALRYSIQENLSLFVLGGGSNILVPDTGVEGLIVRLSDAIISFAEGDDEVRVMATAGATWDDVVSAVSARGLFGIENLAGIPGTVGGAVVQNIGAYGSELKDTFLQADVLHIPTGTRQVIQKDAAEFGYRTSLFKKRPEFVVTSMTLGFARAGTPNLAYPDLASAKESGTPVTTPEEIGEEVRLIRSHKFPNLDEYGTAGSFFKNPVVSAEKAKELSGKFSGLTQFAQKDGQVKVSLAWILDHVLNLNGFSMGRARLFERQPLVIVTSPGATALEVETLASEVAKRVRSATGITIEREVESFGTK